MVCYINRLNPPPSADFELRHCKRRVYSDLGPWRKATGLWHPTKSCWSSIRKTCHENARFILIPAYKYSLAEAVFQQSEK